MFPGSLKLFQRSTEANYRTDPRSDLDMSIGLVESLRCDMDRL